MFKNKSANLIAVYGIFVFLGLLFYFLVLNPLSVYDVDDWLYIYELRKPIPMIHAWNPTRVFPETFMPLVSYFGVLAINPLIDNYYYSLSAAHGLFASILFTLYFVMFVLLFYKRKLASAKRSVAYGAVFVFLHFFSHIYRGHDNPSVLYSINLTCFYFYTLSAIINASLVMYLMSYDGLKKWFVRSSLLNKLIVVIWMYFALNSNLYSSVVLATYIGTDLFINLMKDCKTKKFNLRTYLAENKLDLVVIVWWLAVNLIEVMGGRAGSIHGNLMANLPQTILFGVASLIVKNICILAFEIVILLKWHKMHAKKLNINAQKFLMYIGFQMLYLILLSAYVEKSYIIKSEVILCSFFYIFLAEILCLNSLIKVNEKNKRLPLILLGALAFLLIHPGRMIIPYNFSGIPYNQCEALFNDVLEQFKEAQEKGDNELVVELPKFDSDDNWPLCDFIGERYSEALYRHKVIDSYIKVSDVVFSEEKSREFITGQ